MTTTINNDTLTGQQWSCSDFRLSDLGRAWARSRRLSLALPTIPTDAHESSLFFQCTAIAKPNCDLRGSLPCPHHGEGQGETASILGCLPHAGS